MITLYRRHLRGCPHRAKGQRHWTCDCPLWVRGRIEHRLVRQSTGLTDWSTALEAVRKWELNGGLFPKIENVTTPIALPKTLDEAWQEFLDRKAANENLSESSLSKYQRLRRQMNAFAAGRGSKLLKDWNLNNLEVYQSQWTEAPITRLKKLERMKAFFRFVHTRGGISSNPALELRAPRVPPNPTLPFKPAEMRSIIAAIDQYPDKAGKTGQENAQRLRALVLFLRYSGLRIGDAVRCSIDQIHGTDLYLRTQKTGQAVYCPLPQEVADFLLRIPRLSQKYFFWTGNSKLHTAVGIWERSFKKLFQLANVPHGHAHRFRDTFAVELLIKGVPMDRVSILLGHSSVRITERHYAPWVYEQQQQLIADVRRTHDKDPELSRLATGTHGVRREGSQKANLFIVGGKEVVPAGGIEPTAHAGTL
jgi:integrase/recombinase XerD